MDVVNPSSLAIDADELVVIQLRMNYRQRKAFAVDFADRVNKTAEILGVPGIDPALGADLATELNDVGYARAGSLLSAGQIGDILGHFADRPCFDAHVAAQSDGRPSTVEDLATRAHFGCYRPEDVVIAPHILELANDPRILSAVGSYLGCVPSLYSMNAWWSFPRDNLARLTQTFHRDEDDFKNCVLFLYLTNTQDDGRHEYIRHSHRPEELARHMKGRGDLTVEMPNGETLSVSRGLDELFDGNGYGPGREDVYRALFGHLIDPIGGKAGDAFLTDPDGLHRASHPTKQPRLIVWLRYGMHRNCAYARDLLQPVPRSAVAGRLPETPATRFVNRLVVSPN